MLRPRLSRPLTVETSVFLDSESLTCLFALTSVYWGSISNEALKRKQKSLYKMRQSTWPFRVSCAGSSRRIWDESWPRSGRVSLSKRLPNRMRWGYERHPLTIQYNCDWFFFGWEELQMINKTKYTNIFEPIFSHQNECLQHGAAFYCIVSLCRKFRTSSTRSFPRLKSRRISTTPSRTAPASVNSHEQPPSLEALSRQHSERPWSLLDHRFVMDYWFQRTIDSKGPLIPKDHWVWRAI